MRYFIYAALIWASIGTFLYVRDVEKTIHGSISPDFCTDCPQYYNWLEDQDE